MYHIHIIYMLPFAVKLFTRMKLHNVAHHDNLYRDGNRQLGFEPVIYLFHNEYNHHDHEGDHHITHIAGGDLLKNDL